MGLMEGATECNGGQVRRQVGRRKAEHPVRGSPYNYPPPEKYRLDAGVLDITPSVNNHSKKTIS